MGTWNVAGIAVDKLDTFIEQLSDNYPWDVLLLQEGFRQTDGIASEFNHLLFTSSHLVGNLRCPAILVNERLRDGAEISFAGSGERWVAVSVDGAMLFVSLHLPHSKHSIAGYTAPPGSTGKGHMFWWHNDTRGPYNWTGNPSVAPPGE